MRDINLDLNIVKRKFIPGDTWLYFKIYTGIKTADRILRELLKPISDFLLEKDLIEKWFFIRYRDPHNQLRIRFDLKRADNSAEIMKLFNENFRSFINNDLIWNIQIETYSRELERYGFQNIRLSEKIFFYDSKLIINFLSVAVGDNSEQLRWMFGIKAIDSFLSDFNLDMDTKLDLITVLRSGFAKEFGEDKLLRKQLEKKFRYNRTAITNFLLDPKYGKSLEENINELISQRSEDIRKISTDILEMYNNKMSGRNFFDLMGSYLHMMINRLFRTDQRFHEFILYDFLKRYYTSEIARIKYSKK